MGADSMESEHDLKPPPVIHLPQQSFRIAQLSDIHCGSPHFEPDLLATAVDEILGIEPDLVVIGGDLTAEGYVQEFREAREYLEPLYALRVMVVPGNHDAKNVGYLHFRDTFGAGDVGEKGDQVLSLNATYGREGADGATTTNRKVSLVAVDSSKPDLAEGEVGRERYPWIRSQFQIESDLRILILHHHLVPVPGTGRERNTVWDAGDVLQLLAEEGCDVVLSGHKHVPHVWLLQNVLLINSGTVSSRRLRGYTRPSFNLIEIDDDLITITLRYPGQGEQQMAELNRQTMRLDLNPQLAGMFAKSAWGP